MGECGLHQPTGGPRRCEERNGEPAKWAKGKVVLTVAHMNHTPTPRTTSDLINIAGSLVDSPERSSATNVLDMMDEGTCDPNNAAEIAELFAAGLA